MASKITRWSGVSWVEVANLDKLLLVDGKLNLTGGTMTGPLIINQTAVNAGLTIGKVTTTEGGEINLVNGNDTSFSIDSYGNQLRMHNQATVGFQMNYACDNITFTGGLNLGTNRYGGGYRGINWDAEYMIMGDGTNTFVSTYGTTGTVFIRAGRNGGAQLAINQSNNHSLSGSLTSGADLVAGSWLYAQGGTLVLGSGVWTSMVGWSNSGDNTWVRSLNDKGVYCGGGIFANEGGISCGMGGGMTAGYIADFNGSVYTGHLNTRGGYRITSNGGWAGDWGSQAFIAQKGWSGGRAGYAMHPGGVAKSMHMLENNHYVGFYNESAAAGTYLEGYAELYAWSYVIASKKALKQDIAPWPPKSAGSAVMNAANRLSLIDVITYRQSKEAALIQAETMEMHDCATDDCKGTDMETDPCMRVKDWQNPMLGIIIEDLATVLPEAVASDNDGNPGGMRVNTMIGYLLAVCKEQEERLVALEHQREEAA